MELKKFEAPGTVALTQFRDRVAQDGTLSASIKAAVLEDSTSPKPYEFEQLKAVLTGELKAHEDHNA